VSLGRSCGNEDRGAEPAGRGRKTRGNPARIPLLECHPSTGAGWSGLGPGATLDAFLADPQAIVPGNSMGFFGLRDAQDRSDLIAYLEQAKERR
jgi:hypothetical protein